MVQKLWRKKGVNTAKCSFYVICETISYYKQKKSPRNNTAYNSNLSFLPFSFCLNQTNEIKHLSLSQTGIIVDAAAFLGKIRPPSD